MEKTHWKKLTDPNYLGSWDFAPGEVRTLTIERVLQEKVIDMEKGGTAKKDCTIAHFVEKCKPMILNKTNCKTIAALLNTPYIEEWAGHRIKIHVEKVKAFGRLEDALRVINELPKDIICESCGQAVKAVGRYTALQVAETNKGRYGKVLCADCSKKIKEDEHATQS